MKTVRNPASLYRCFVVYSFNVKFRLKIPSCFDERCLHKTVKYILRRQPLKIFGTKDNCFFLIFIICLFAGLIVCIHFFFLEKIFGRNFFVLVVFQNLFKCPLPPIVVNFVRASFLLWKTTIDQIYYYSFQLFVNGILGLRELSQPPQSVTVGPFIEKKTQRTLFAKRYNFFFPGFRF